MNRDEALRILVLGSEATVDEARRAYREQVKLWHPDRYSDNSALKSMALKNAQDANRAWAYLRPRLPRSRRRPNHSGAKLQASGRHRQPPGDAARSSRKIGLSERLRQGALRLAPLMARIRQLPLDAIAGWLRHDPNRHYRPWYRYAREAGDNTARGRSDANAAFGCIAAKIDA